MATVSTNMQAADPTRLSDLDREFAGLVAQVRAMPDAAHKFASLMQAWHVPQADSVEAAG